MTGATFDGLEEALCSKEVTAKLRFDKSRKIIRPQKPRLELSNEHLELAFVKELPVLQKRL